MEETTGYFQSNLPEWCRDHLSERYGLTPATIETARIGYAPTDRYALSLHLLEAGFSGEAIRQSGLVSTYDGTPNALWRGRILFPYLQDGKPRYFIGRKTDHTADGLAGKYIKQKRMNGAIQEPIYGADTVLAGEPLIITEGITDAIIAHQAGYPCISPVTIRFKQDRVGDMVELCGKASELYLIMDNEDNDAGLKGAVDTGLTLARAGLEPYLCTIPRAEGEEKVDLNDFIRAGGVPAELFPDAVYVEDHPLAEERVREQISAAARQIRRDEVQKRTKHARRRGGKQPQGLLPDIGAVKQMLPPITYFTGGEGLLVHPVYGSKSGGNLSVDGRRDMWYCFHKGNEGGGDVLKWIAVYELELISEGEDLRGEAFVKTVRYVEEKYGEKGK